MEPVPAPVRHLRGHRHGAPGPRPGIRPLRGRPPHHPHRRLERPLAGPGDGSRRFRLEPTERLLPALHPGLHRLPHRHGPRRRRSRRHPRHRREPGPPGPGPVDGAAGDLAPGPGHLLRRLRQHPGGGDHHAPGLRPPADLPGEARLPRRLHGGPGGGPRRDQHLDRLRGRSAAGRHGRPGHGGLRVRAVLPRPDEPVLLLARHPLRGRHRSAAPRRRSHAGRRAAGGHPRRGAPAGVRAPHRGRSGTEPRARRKGSPPTGGWRRRRSWSW